MTYGTIMPWVSRPVVISETQRKELMRIARSKKSSEVEKCRALIVLLLAEGLKNTDIARRLHVHENTVVKWRGRWTGDNHNATIDDHGVLTGRPRSVLTPDKLEKIKALIETTPPDNKRWTVRSIGKAMNLPVATAQRALQELGINLTQKIKSI